jgi:hypothetical protein
VVFNDLVGGMEAAVHGVLAKAVLPFRVQNVAAEVLDQLPVFADGKVAVTGVKALALKNRAACDAALRILFVKHDNIANPMNPGPLILVKTRPTGRR